MNKFNTYHHFISASLVVVLAGLVFEVLHTPGMEWLMAMSDAGVLLLSLLAGVELIQSCKMSLLTKIAWIGCFFFFNPVAVLIYYYRQIHSGFRYKAVL